MSHSFLTIGSRNKRVLFPVFPQLLFLCASTELIDYRCHPRALLVSRNGYFYSGLFEYVIIKIQTDLQKLLRQSTINTPKSKPLGTEKTYRTELSLESSILKTIAFSNIRIISLRKLEGFVYKFCSNFERIVRRSIGFFTRSKRYIISPILLETHQAASCFASANGLSHVRFSFVVLAHHTFILLQTVTFVDLWRASVTLLARVDKSLSLEIMENSYDSMIWTSNGLWPQQRILEVSEYPLVDY
ncbi:unnamed protein product [Albugo candida]|uniref:Uncharacterized protein n=1 Tax=Albugo candida TaxID=65357 RepID=A0A024GD73_9STRA|nr:unnamed protein product [Albugo candida]|eukprot:CCI44806.1 unnamed protein product [Albugo candida]